MKPPDSRYDTTVGSMMLGVFMETEFKQCFERSRNVLNVPLASDYLNAFTLSDQIQQFCNEVQFPSSASVSRDWGRFS